MHYLLIFLMGTSWLTYSNDYPYYASYAWSTTNPIGSVYNDEDSCMKVVEKLIDPTSAVCVPIHGFVKNIPSYTRY